MRNPSAHDLKLTPTPRLFSGRVVHQRSAPRQNAFSYGIYYVAVPLPAEPLPNRFMKLDWRALGARDGSSPEAWADHVLATLSTHDATSDQAPTAPVSQWMLLTLPSVLGYVFNPISFYFGLDRAHRLRAVIGEVHNTYGEQHVYVCMNDDGSPLRAQQTFNVAKQFHVSPFFARDGHYRFRFDLDDHRLKIWIDHDDPQHQHRLSTALIGELTPLTAPALRRAFWRYPLVTLKVISLIHWQALKLVAKGLPFLSKPAQLATRFERAHHLPDSSVQRTSADDESNSASISSIQSR